MSELDPHQRAALNAWRSLEPSRGRPIAVTTLEAGLEPTSKTAVFRLHGALSGGCNVIAKRSFRAAAELEQRIYRAVLPTLDVTRVELYGAIEDANRPALKWLFMQDVGDAMVGPEQEIFVARWLANFHATANLSASACMFPSHGVDHYRQLLIGICDRIGALLAKPCTPERREGRELLRQTLALLELLEAGWPSFASFLEELPMTLTHGDFARKNIRVLQQQVYAIDWEMAGWGSPAVDLALVGGRESTTAVAAIHEYTSTIRRHWPKFDARRTARARRVGKVMHCIRAIEWATCRLDWAWYARPFYKLEGEIIRFGDALRSLKGLV